VHFTIRHPDDPSVKATYGHDPARGVWAELTYCGVRVVFDATEIDFDFERPVLGVLRFLNEYGFVSAHDFDAAFERLTGREHGWPSRRRRSCGRGVRCVIEILETLEAAG
jgi:hypothetical protein